MLRIAVQYVTGGQGGWLQQGIGAVMGTGGGAAGGGSGGLGSLGMNNLGLVGAGIQALTGASVGASGASLAVANGVGALGGDALGTLIAANGGWAGVSAGVGAAGAGAAGGAAAGGAVAAGGAGAGLGATAAAVIPVVGWVIAAAALLYAAFGQKPGGPKAEGFYNPYNSDRYFTRNTSEVANASKKAAAGIQSQYDSLVGAFKGQGGVQFGLGFAADPIGDAPTMLNIGVGKNGQALTNFTRNDVGRDQADLQQAIAEESTRAILLGLQQAGIAGKIGDYLASLGDVARLSADQVAEAIARIQKAGTERATLEQKVFDLTHTELERVTAAREKERAALDESNQALYDHVARLTDLTNTLATQRDQLIEAYQNESAELQGVVTRNSQYARSLRETRDSLLVSNATGSRAERAQRAQGIFSGTLSSAIAGNEDALQGLGGAGKDRHAPRPRNRLAVRQSARTPAEVAAAIVRVTEGLTTAASSADGRSTVAQKQLDTMKEQLTALGLLNTSVLSFGEALTAYLATQEAIQNAKFPGFAVGGLAAGRSIVGERGPEFVDFQTPGRVYTNDQTKGMFASNAESVPLLRAVVARLDALLSDGRTVDVATVTALQKMEAKFRKWDTVGMPLGKEVTA